MSNPVKLRILIVGAGPAGLTTALALARQSHAVTVLERSPILQTNGGEVSLQCPALKILTAIGLGEPLHKIGVTPVSMNTWSYEDSAESGPRASVPIMKGYDIMRIARPDLQRIVYEAAVGAGVKVLFAQRVNKLEEVEGAKRVRVWTEDGKEYEADLVIGVDGLKSIVRRYIFPGLDVEPVALREVIFQALVPKSVVERDERLKLFREVGALHTILSPGSMLIFTTQTDGGLRAVCTEIDYGSPEHDRVNASWSTEGDPEEVRRLFAGFSEHARAVLEHITECTRWRMARVKPIESWSSEAGRVVLLGDAAHAMLPHAAQGLSQGVEDAMALSEILKYTSPDQSNIPELVSLLEQFRRPRTTKFWEIGEENTARHTLPLGEAQNSRFEVWRKMAEAVRRKNAMGLDWGSVKMDMHAERHTLEHQKWLRAYDVKEELHRFMDASRIDSKWQITYARVGVPCSR